MHRRLFRRAGLRVGSQRYSLDVIEHGVLRVNRRPPYAPRRLLRRSDPRLAAAPSRLDPRVHFALNCGAASCPPIRSYAAQDIDRQLDLATCSYLAAEATIDAEAATVTLPGLLRLYRRDFGSRRAQLELLAKCRSGDQAAWLRENAARVRVRYSRFDWTIAAGATT